MNRAFVVIVLLALVAGLAWWATGSYNAAVDRADQAEDAARDLRVQLTNATGATVTVTQYVDRVQTIHEKGATIIKEVTRYVPVQADAACLVPHGFVRLHDAAAAGAVPDPSAGDADAAPSGVALSTVAGTVTANYTTSHANSEQLSALQQTLRDQGVTTIGEERLP